MKTVALYAAASIAAIVLLIALSVGIGVVDLGAYKFFAPKYEAARRETFEQSKSYREGMAQELSNFQAEYEQADDKHKAALRSIILHRAAGVPEDALPAHLNQFLAGLRNAQ